MHYDWSLVTSERKLDVRRNAVPKQTDDNRQLVQRRMPRDERVAAMLDQAVGVLADEGLGVSTRRLASALGVTQGLIYKHFASKEAFVAAALERAFGGKGRDPAALHDEATPLAERLVAFYAGRSDKTAGSRIRLFVRAALEGWPVPARRGAALTHQVFEPVVRAFRKEAGLPSLEEKPMLRGERELVMMLHGSVVFLGIREHVYHMPMPDDRDAVVRLQVDIFLGGAIPALRRIHAGEAGASLMIEQLGRGRREQA
jgi:AcrR family transcriptional regulator